MDPHLYLTHAAAIEAAIAAAVRRSRAPVDEQDDAAGYMRLRLLADNCRILRSFAERGGLRRYLNVVIGRLLLDYRVEQWGKWRPSAAGRRLGDPAIRFERLVYRDGYTPGEARRALACQNVQLTASSADRLTRRNPRRRQVAMSVLEVMPSSIPGPEEDLQSKEQRHHASQLARVLRSALARLTPEEHALLYRRFDKGGTLAELARERGTAPRLVYGQLESVLRKLRLTLSHAGIGRDDVLAVLNDRSIAIPALLRGRAVPRRPLKERTNATSRAA